MSDQFEFGRFVAERRKRHVCAMRRFVDMLGVTAPYCSDIEKGRRAAPDGKLEEIAIALKLSRAEREQMLDLAALTRENQVSADLSGYIMETELARVALRRAKEQDLSDGR